MAHLAHEPALPVAERFQAKDAGLLPTILLGVGVISIVLAVIIGLFPSMHAQFAHSWLFASFYFFTLCAGSLFWVIIHHATDAEWSVVVRRHFENTSSLLWVFFFFFFPLLVMHLVSKDAPLWHWWNVAEGVDPLLDAKAGFLNHKFFTIRFFLYFILLGGLAWFLRNQSVAQDTDGKGSRSHVMRRTAVGGLIIFGVSLTFAAVDWLMGLDYHWFSTMWGVYIFAGCAGSSMALGVVAITTLRERGYYKPVSMEHYHIMGKWLLAFTIFWAYIGFDQYMLIWYANIPEENIYFRIRNTESWHYFSTFLVVGRFFLPFPVLLTQFIKKKPTILRFVALWILLMQLIDIYVIVLPALHHFGFRPSILDVLSFAGVGGVVGWLWFRALGSVPMFPTKDPRLGPSIRLTN